MRRRDILIGAGALIAGPAFAQAPVRVALETGQGRILLELAADKAPITCANFLRYVNEKRYDGSTLYRAMRMAWDAGSGLIQGGLQNDPARLLPPIAHESTAQTGLSHTDGTISLARFAPGTATSDFFICAGDFKSLDADPNLPGDNLGFAAFGKVVEGMDVVRKILGLPTSPTKGAEVGMTGQILEPPVPIVSARVADRPSATWTRADSTKA
jgi:peptidyl-prolyl cis-trans isomerase A (cyclophilin A)